jgi:hypothetical protein
LLKRRKRLPKEEEQHVDIKKPVNPNYVNDANPGTRASRLIEELDCVVETLWTFIQKQSETTVADRDRALPQLEALVRGTHPDERRKWGPPQKPRKWD